MSDRPPSNSAPLLVSMADQSFSRTKSIGILNVSLGLVRALAKRPECPALKVFGNGEIAERLGADTRAKMIRVDGVASSRLRRLWYDQVGLYRLARRQAGSWLLLPKGYASFLLPPPSSLRLACYVHDTMVVHYQLRHPGHFPRSEQYYFLHGLRSSLRRADLILTNSRFTADELLGLSDSRLPHRPAVECVGIGFDRPAPVQSPKGERSGVMVLSSPHPHKRTSQAIDWMTRWQRERDFGECVHWVGGLPEGLQLPALNNWRRAPRLTDEAFQGFMKEVRALVYFTEYEGFGMPPVEAVLHGAAPVYSDIPATKEVMVGRGYPFDNRNYDSFSRSLSEAVSSVGLLSRWRAELLEELRWPDVARRTLAAMAEVSNRP